MIVITTTLVAFTLISVFLIYACVIADPESSDVGRFCSKQLPSMLHQKLEKIAGEKVLSKLEVLLEHAYQLVYLTVVLGSWSIMFCYGYEEIEKSNYIHSYHQYSGYIVFIMCMSSFHYACYTHPGNVTARTISLFDHYEYDDVLYKNQICPTLKIRKIARSKYDRFTRRHVPRFDHFCGWINQSVGEQNYRWFLLFLTIHVIMCFYGSWAVYRILYGEVMDKDLLNATFFNSITGAEVKADSWIVFHYLFMRHSQLCSIFILMSVMAVVLFFFLSFHLYITSKNMTTNEFFKWKSVRRWHKREKRKYDEYIQNVKVADQRFSKPSIGRVPDPGELDVDVGCVGPRGDVVYSPSLSAADNNEVTHPGNCPTNIYDKGIIANFKEVLFPYSLREDAVQRYRIAQSKHQNPSSERECKAKNI